MKKQVKEIFLLRSIACLVIVFMHSVTLAVNNLNMSDLTVGWLDSIRMALMFGTPMFIFISEFVIAYSYPSETPKGFIKKRFLYVFLPFISMAIFYAGFNTVVDNASLQSFIISAFKNITIGSFHGYFILIIFQFYLLHMFFIKYIVPKYSPSKVISVSIGINVIYLAFFNFLNLEGALSFIPGIERIWIKANTLPFVAWLGYFSVAYYCGRKPELLIAWIKRHKSFVFAMPVVTLALLQYVYHSQLLGEMHSKRVDVLFYTFSLLLLLSYLATKIRYIPKFINVISQYSFGIYLLHPFFLALIPLSFIKEVTIMNVTGIILLAFILGIGLSIISVSALNKFKVGKYIVGRVGKEYNNVELYELKRKKSSKTLVN